MEGGFGVAEISNFDESNIKKDGVEVIIPQFSWNKISEKYNLLDPSFIKIDVDGFELNVIRAISLEKWKKVKHLLIEINDKDVIREINNLGFKIYDSDGFNYIFSK